jgi:coatomer subunit beta'
MLCTYPASTTAEVSIVACCTWHMQVAEQCLNNASDLSGLLLLTSARGDVTGLRKLIESAEAAGRLNVAFVARFLLGDLAE